MSILIRTHTGERVSHSIARQQEAANSYLPQRYPESLHGFSTRITELTLFALVM